MNRSRSIFWAGLLAAVAVLFAGPAVSGARAAALPRAAAAPAWTQVATPNPADWVVRDVSCFGDKGLVLAGDGRVAISKDGGGRWTVTVPGGYEGTVFTAADFTTAGSGVVASGGLLLVTHDWGATWAPPVFVGSGAIDAIEDVAVRGDLAVAVGAGGMILASSDGGATWRSEASPVSSRLTSVALAAGGTAIAGSAGGQILVRGTSWAVAGDAGAPVTSVSAASPVVWGDGSPDLFAATGHTVLGSDDGATFAALPGLPDLSAAVWPAVAWAGRPDGTVVVAGGAEAGFLSSTGAWSSGATGLTASVGAAAPGDQSVAYLLDADGRLVRTLSAGREPASAKLARSRLVAGASTRLSATIRVAAPGTVLVRGRVPGRPWQTVRKVAWTTSDWRRTVNVGLSPTLNHEYVLEFRYGGATIPLTPTVAVTAVPRIKVARTRYALRAGAVFRFSGTVSPKLKGERVDLLTDRGGSWRPVSLQQSVALRDGRTWQSRKFGTPKAETYHLRARLAKTSRHAEALSPVVTVSIR